MGYRANRLNQCERCSIFCETCSIATDYCDSCSQSLGFPYKLDGTCNAECPVGTYKSEATLTCEPCINNCLTCLTQDVCLSCTPGTFFLDTECLEVCPVTSITYDTVTRQECDLCIEPCYTCEGTTSTCTSCITGFYFHENECVSECPSGYEVSED